jgi:chromate transporter
MQQSHDTPPVVGARELFLAFTSITLTSFGGAIFWARRALVEQKRWLSDPEFVELLALAQLLPGASGVNLSVLVGYRYGRVRGALAALAGFLAAPFAVIMVLGFLHREFGDVPVVRSALTGMAAVAVGLLLATAARMIVVLQRQWLPWIFVGAAFVGIGVMRWPFVTVVGVLAPIAVAVLWKERRA